VTNAKGRLTPLPSPRLRSAVGIELSSSLNVETNVIFENLGNETVDPSTNVGQEHEDMNTWCRPSESHLVTLHISQSGWLASSLPAWLNNEAYER